MSAPGIHKRRVFYVILVALALIGMLALWRSTPYGLGLVNDSATYVEGAANLLAGKGYVRVSGGGELKPITHFPPLFSLLLASFGLFGMDLLQAARVLITVLFGIDILLVGLTAYKISQSMVFASLGALLLAVSDLHLGVYSFALSEPLFITLMLAAFLCLAEGFNRPDHTWPVAAGMFLSLAYLTRFAGISLLITVLLVIIVLKPTRALKQFIYVLAGALPLSLIWFFYNMLTSGAEGVGNRQLLWHPLPLKTLFEALKNLLTWIAPNDLLNLNALWGRILSFFSLLLLPALAAWLVWVVWRRVNRTELSESIGGSIPLAFTHGLHILVYLAFMVVSLTLFDASTPLNDRLLSVVYIPEMVLLSSGLAWLWGKIRQRKAAFRWGLAFLVLLLVVFSVKDGYAAMNTLGREGQGFAHRGISGSPAIQAVRRLPATLIYSNKPGAIFLLTGRTAYVTPTPVDPVTGQGRLNYTDDLALMQQRVRDGQAILVVFGLRNSPDPDEAKLFNALADDLTIMGDYGDILIFGASP